MWPWRASALAIAMIVSGGSHSASSSPSWLRLTLYVKPTRIGCARRWRTTPSWLAVARPERIAAAFSTDAMVAL